MKAVASANIIAVSHQGVRSLPANRGLPAEGPGSGTLPPEGGVPGRGERRIYAAAPEPLIHAAAGERHLQAAAGAAISRRTALRQFALGAAALGLGLQRASAPPSQNNQLGVNVEFPVGSWYTQCIDNNGSACANPIWRNLTAAGYVNGNYAGNNLGFSSQGGQSDMFTTGLPFTTGAIYRISYDVEVINSFTTNDKFFFIINNTRTLDILSGTAAKTNRSFLLLGEPTVDLRWRFVKAAGGNASIRFRVDNLQITELPPPTLTVENCDGSIFQCAPDSVVVWWPAAYGGPESSGTELYESTSLNPATWVLNTDPPFYRLDASHDNILGFGKLIPKLAATKYFRVRVSGNPSL